MQSIFLALAALLAASAPAQQAFAELGRAHLPIPPALPLPLTLGDFDGDGDLDAIRGERVYENMGDARFRPRGRGAWTRALIAADVDGDGDDDLVEFHGGSSARLWLSNGRFGFVADPRTPMVTAEDWPSAVEDLDGDGRDDVICGLFGVTTLQPVVWFSDPVLGLRSVVLPTLPAAAGPCQAADFDGDGDIDLLFPPHTLMRNDGSGGFTIDPAGVTTSLTGPAAIVATGDVDGNSAPDVVQSFGSTHELLRNVGGRLIGVPMTIDRDAGPWRSIGLIDVDGDGRSELLFGAPLELYRGGPNWQRQPGALPSARSTLHVRIADLDQDGFDDVIESFGEIWLADGRGGLIDATPLPIEAEVARPLSFACADFDGDGDQDVVGFDRRAPHTGRVWINDGDGRFAATALLPPLGFAPASLPHAADFDGDGDVDLYVPAQRDTGPLRGDALLLNDGRGRFTRTAGRVAPPVDLTARTYVCDPDGDGDPDIARIVHGPTPRLELLENDGRGSLTRVVTLVSGVECHAAAFADVDGDGHCDLFLARRSTIVPGLELEMHWRDASGAYASVTPLLPRYQVGELACGDADGDGDVDLLFSHLGGLLGLFLHDGQRGFTDATPTHAPPTGSYRSLGLRLGDLDEDGDLDVVLGDAVLDNQAGRFVESGRVLRSFDGEPLYEDGQPQTLVDIDGDGDLDLVGFDLRILQNHHRQLQARLVARAGRSYAWRISCRAGYLTAPAAAWLIVGTRERSLPLGALGTLRIDPLAITPAIPIPSAGTNGTADVELRLPADPRLVGVPLLGQALVLPPGGAPRLSNATRDVIR